jgi:alpha-1,6-mannosyltransferase
VAPYALLLIVFLWGKRPWMWSGFLHAGMLGYDISYPSTFAAVAMFLAWSLLLDALDQGRTLPYAAIALLLGLCLVTHPPTAVVLLAGLAALFVARVRRPWLPQAAWLAGAIAAGAASCLAWPYYPVLALFTDQPREFHLWSGVFYANVLRRTWPIILATPVLLWRLRADRRDPLVLMAAVLAGIYAVGALTEAYGLGRTIAYLAILVQIAVAAALVALELRMPAGRRWLVPAATLVILGGLFVYSEQPLPRLLKYDPQPWREAAAILAPVRPGEVVLTNSLTGYYVPAVTGARVVAWRHPIYWIPDHEERRAAQKRFFGETSLPDRQETLERYGVRWILLNRAQAGLSAADETGLLSLGCVAGERDSLVLVDVDRRRRCDPAAPSTR